MTYAPCDMLGKTDVILSRTEQSEGRVEGPLSEVEARVRPRHARPWFDKLTMTR